MTKLLRTTAGIWILGLAALSAAAATKERTVIELWPADRIEEKTKEEAKVSKWRGVDSITRLHNVSRPILTVFQPPKGKANGAAVVVCPGGGYSILAYDLEGTEICEWLNTLGVTAFLLKYRVPKQRDAAFQDIQRAVGLVRHGAAKWGVDVKRIGVLGFSAGGHLCARLCTNYHKRTYPTVDAADAVACRPDFAVLIYPAYLHNRNKTGVDAKNLPVNAKTPPAFLAMLTRDGHGDSALVYYRALRRAKVCCELHAYAFGSHGCGLRAPADNASTWPTQCARWLRDAGLLGAK